MTPPVKPVPPGKKEPKVRALTPTLTARNERMLRALLQKITTQHPELPLPVVTLLEGDVVRVCYSRAGIFGFFVFRLEGGNIQPGFTAFAKTPGGTPPKELLAALSDFLRKNP